MNSLELPDALSALEPLGQQVNQGGIDVVDAATNVIEFSLSRFVHALIIRS